MNNKFDNLTNNTVAIISPLKISLIVVFFHSFFVIALLGMMFVFLSSGNAEAEEFGLLWWLFYYFDMPLSLPFMALSEFITPHLPQLGYYYWQNLVSAGYFLIAGGLQYFLIATLVTTVIKTIIHKDP
jgi:hypothetical protein